MTKKLLALALTGALSLITLASCASPGGGAAPTATPAPAPTETYSPPPAESAPPSETVSPSQTPAPAETPTPSETVKPTESAKPSKQPAPSEKPAMKPTPAPESPQPSETPIPEPTVSVVKSIWNQVSGLSRPALIDMDAGLLSDLYGIEAGDLEEFVAKMPAMSANVSEFLIAKCAPGRVDTVKQACLDRQAALAADDRYPESVQLVKDYKLVTGGDYLLFAIDEHASAMASAFNTFAK